MGLGYRVSHRRTISRPLEWIGWHVHGPQCHVFRAIFTRRALPGNQVQSIYKSGHNGPLDRYVKLWFARAPGMPGTFSPHRGLAIPTCITARAWSTCCDACRDRKLAVSSEVRGGQNVPGTPGACATHNFTYLIRGPYNGFYIYAFLNNFIKMDQS